MNLRKAGIHAEYDTVGRSVKAQMKYADKIGAIYNVVLGDDEIANDKVRLKYAQWRTERNYSFSY